MTPLTTDRLAPLAAALRRGDLDPVAYVDRLAERCAARDGEIRALVPEEGRFERLRREAEALGERFPEPGARPPLFAVPVGIKDIFRVDGFDTRAGSRLPASEFAGPEAASVTALRAAGALVLGKTVSTEFAYFAPGPTRNPHHLGHTPGGSSSGSAAAVAAGLCPLALGTQTYGSISRPAAFCGVVGYKPSAERISRHGVVPLSPSLDHVGSFTADVAGARLVASLLCRRFRPSTGPGDAGVAPTRGQADAAGPPVLGVPVGPYLEAADDSGRRHFAATCRRLAAAGYVIREVETLADPEEIRRRHQLIVAAEAAEVHRRWYTGYPELYDERLVELIESGRSISIDEHTAALVGRGRLRRRLKMEMKAAGLDLWITPGAPGPAPAGLGSTGDPVMNLPWTHAGLPTLCLPAGKDPAGLPLGLQLVARWCRDEDLLAWGEEIEGALG